jgi:transposase
MQVELEQRIIIQCLMRENMDTHEILAELQAHFEDKAYALPTVRFWIGEVRRGREDLSDKHRSGRPALDHIDTQILHILGKSPFESARSIAQTLNTLHHVVLHYLHEVLGFKSFHLR